MNLWTDVFVDALSVVLVFILEFDDLDDGEVGTPTVAADAITFAVVCIPLPIAYKKSTADCDGD